MKSILLLIVCLLLSSGNSMARQADPDKNFIYWSKDYRLTFTDFDKLPERYSENAALSFLGFESNFEMSNMQYKATIKTYFDKDSSWARSWVPILLAHEQGHFDIAETHARMLRMRLKKAMEADDLDVSKFESMTSQILKELEVAQKEYDNATNHSLDYRAQLEWLDRIQNNLDDLNDFAQTQVLVKRQ